MKFRCESGFLIVGSHGTTPWAPTDGKYLGHLNVKEIILSCPLWMLATALFADHDIIVIHVNNYKYHTETIFEKERVVF